LCGAANSVQKPIQAGRIDETNYYSLTQITWRLTMAKKETASNKVNETVKNTFDQVIEKVEENQSKAAGRVVAARARNSRIVDQYLSNVNAGQKDAIELAKAYAAAPTDYKANLQLVVDNMTKAQERALELGKLVYREQSEVSKSYGDFFKAQPNLFAGYTDRLNESFEKMTAMWSPAK